jgi:hypothetical protein
MMEGVRLEHEKKLQQQRLDVEREIANRKLDLEQQRLELEKEKAQASSTEESSQEVAPEVNRALLALTQRFPDFKDHFPEMTRLSGIFAPGKSPDLTVEKYLEGLYVIARYASFSNTQAKLAGPALTNADIMTLAQAKVEESVILLKVRTSPARYRFGIEDLVNLSKAGVSGTVIDAMIEAAVPIPRRSPN